MKLLLLTFLTTCFAGSKHDGLRRLLDAEDHTEPTYTEYKSFATKWFDCISAPDSSTSDSNIEDLVNAAILVDGTGEGDSPAQEDDADGSYAPYEDYYDTSSDEVQDAILADGTLGETTGELLGGDMDGATGGNGADSFVHVAGPMVGADEPVGHVDVFTGLGSSAGGPPGVFAGVAVGGALGGAMGSMVDVNGVALGGIVGVPAYVSGAPAGGEPMAKFSGVFGAKRLIDTHSDEQGPEDLSQLVTEVAVSGTFDPESEKVKKCTSDVTQEMMSPLGENISEDLAALAISGWVQLIDDMIVGGR